MSLPMGGRDQVLEQLLLLSRVNLMRKLESEAELGLDPRHVGIPGQCLDCCPKFPSLTLDWEAVNLPLRGLFSLAFKQLLETITNGAYIILLIACKKFPHISGIVVSLFFNIKKA